MNKLSLDQRDDPRATPSKGRAAAMVVRSAAARGYT
jgi:hypothetical protein